MTDRAGSGLPIVGQLSRLSATFLVGTVVLSLAAIVLDFGLHVDETVLFVVSAAAILGLAWVVGLSTERLGSITGPQVGGILNATFGNIAELIIGFLALQAGLIQVVKASLTGSIIGNLLLVMGLSALVGGLKNGSQHFSPKIAVSNAALLGLALIGLFVPAIFALTTKDPTSGSITQESVLVAGALIVGYVLSLAYQFRRPDQSHGAAGDANAVGGAREEGGPPWSGRTAVVVLLGAAALLAVLSEILVSSITPFIATFKLSFFFVGVVIIPTIGNLAEHLVSVQLAAKDKMEFALAVTFGSSLQIALFVAPVLVLLGALMGRDMNLVFTPLEIAAVAAAVGISSLIAIDGETNWLEGALLTLVYAILAISFFGFVGGVAT
jgi:Ca2+:H+ antiporter